MTRSLRVRDGAKLAAALGSILLGAVLVPAQEPGKYPLLRSCSQDAEVLTMLDASQTVKIRFNYSGDAGNCYAVTASVGGKTIDGYLIGAGHPSIAAFEKEVRSQVVRIPAPAAAVGPAIAVPANPSLEPAAPPLSFAGFRAVSIDGWPVDLSRERAPNVFIYFWSARSRAGIRTLDAMESIYNTYHARGVYVVGVGAAADADQLKKVASESEAGGKQVLDRGLAARYHVDPAKPFMILDQSRKVIAAAPTALALKPILDQLTKYRSSRP